VVSGLRLKETITTLTITGNTFSNNPIGIEITSSVPDVSTWAVNYNHIVGNTAYGISNAAVAGTLDATNNWWGFANGPSFTFDYGLGSGSGDEVSRYVDYTPWYDTSIAGASYYPTVTKYLMQINPTEPYQDNYFDLRIAAADVNGTRNQDYNNRAEFSSNHVALSVPGEQLLVDGFKEIFGGCISSLPFVAGDNLAIEAWEYPTASTHQSFLTPIVIHGLCSPAAPTNVVFADDPGDNGGWILLTYTVSVDDPFYLGSKGCAGVSYYNVYRSDALVPSPDTTWIHHATIGPDSTGSDDRIALLNAPASDDLYAYRMCSVHNPSKANFGDDHIIYEPIPMAKGASQSEWVYGSAAAKDNLPAYANMKVFFEGPYQASGTMYDDLTLLTVSPYDSEDIGTLPSVAGRTLIDWIYVELRNTETGATVKEANAFVLDNGMIVDTEGNYSLPFYYTTNVEYFMVIHHRNHLDIMSAKAHTFGDFASEATSIDLTTVGTAYLDGFKETVNTGVYAMYDGDANGSELVNVNDAYDLINHFGMSGYLGSDLNLSGYVNVNDAYELIRNYGVGSSVPGNTLKDGPNNGQNIDFNVPITTGVKVLECTLEIKNVQVVAGVSYSFDVYITRNTSNWSALGHLIFITETYYSELGFNYNGSALNNPVISGLSTVATGTNVSTPSSGVLSIEVIDGGINVPVSETKLLTVTFDVTDPSATSQLSWKPGDTSIIDESSTQYSTSDGTLSLIGSDDSTLPVELSIFTAQYLDKIPVLYWETESETNNMGWFVYRNNEDDFTTAQKVSEFIDGHGTTSENNSYTHEDTIEEPVSGDVYYYWLESIDYGGIVHHYDKAAQLTIPDLVDPGSEIARPEIFGLLQNAPNPFVNGTSIVFNLHQTAQVELKIYNIKGELVKDLYSGVSDYKSLQWNGTDDTGKQLSPGIYLYNLTVNGKSQEIKKLILMR